MCVLYETTRRLLLVIGKLYLTVFGLSVGFIILSSTCSYSEHMMVVNTIKIIYLGNFQACCAITQLLDSLLLFACGFRVLFSCY